MPIYLQITQQIIQCIQVKSLTTGNKLPGSRLLANNLNVNRNTIVAAYNELDLQGWIKIEPNKGAFVLEYSKNKSIESVNTKNVSKKFSLKSNFSFKQNRLTESPYKKSTALYQLTDGIADARLYPMKDIAKWYAYALKNFNKISSLNNKAEENNFNSQLTNYLNLTRNLKIEPSNLVTTQNFETCLYIISQLLFEKNDIVLVAEKNHYKANMIIQNTGAKLIEIPIDNEGIVVDFVRKHFLKSSIKAIYINSQRNYPSTITLSAKRRIELLEIAKEYNFLIIEENADFDIEFQPSNVLPMASFNTDGNLIYLGKFAQLFSSAFELGFIVAPTDFVNKIKDYIEMLSLSKDLLTQYTLESMLKEGEIHRLQKKMNLTYKQRRDFFYNQLKQKFNDEIECVVPSGGMAFWIEFKNKISLKKLSDIALSNNLYIPLYIMYQQKDICALRIGFANFSTTEIEEIINILHKSYLDCK